MLERPLHGSDAASFINDVLLRGGDDALSVNWFELTVVNAKTGEQLYQNSFITNHRLSADNIAAVAQAGRALEDRKRK